MATEKEISNMVSQESKKEEALSPVKLAIYQFFFKINSRFTCPLFIYAFLQFLGYCQFIIFLLRIERDQFGALPGYLSSFFDYADSYVVKLIHKIFNRVLVAVQD